MSDDTTPARADVNPGDKVAGFRLEEQIGQGGMAVVYRAYDERLDRRVALKVLAPGLAADTAFRTRFIRESRAAAAVDHPNIIPVYDAGDAGGCLFISMRYVQGGDVRSLLADDHALPPARAWNIIGQVAAALDAAHAHDLIHRDVKPANMLLDRGSGETSPQADATSQSKEHVYLSDFGISKQTVASNLTSTGQFLGTLDYIAPEQIEGQGIDGRADQYSLACAAYELLCGTPPFERSNGFALINSHLSEMPPAITTLRPELPAAVDRVLSKAMSKSAARRYATCTQFATDLGRSIGLLPGPLEADGVPAAGHGPDAGDQAEQRPATELAQPGAGRTAPGANRSPLTPAEAAAVSEGTGQAAAQGALDPETMLTAQPGVSDRQTVDGQAARGGQQAPAAQQGARGQQGPQGQQGARGQQGPQGQQWPAGAWAAGQPGTYGPNQAFPQPGGPSGPGGMGGPGWTPYPPPQPPRRSRGVLVGALTGAVVVAVAAASVAVVVLNRSNDGPSPSTSPSSTPTAAGRRQATTVSTLLASMAKAHQMLQTAVLDIGNNCQYLSSSQFSDDVTAIQNSAADRQSELDQARALDVSALPSGAPLKADLTRALSNSLRADNNYVIWARQERTGCFPSSQSSEYEAANTFSARANTAKASFATIWNTQVAPKYGQASVSPTDM